MSGSYRVRVVVRWTVLLACYLAFFVVVFGTNSGNGPLWFLAGLAVAWAVPRLWRWSKIDQPDDGRG